MVCSFGLSASLAAVLLVATPAISVGQQFTSTDVTEFFLEQTALSATRGICVGTAQECADQAAPVGFDVMVTFELNSDALTSEAILNLTEVASALADERLQDTKFVVEGHTDASGQETYNDVLSERRARRVAEFLVSKGVAADRMISLGLGEKSPRAEDPFDPLNRRVEMKLNLQ